MTRKELYGHIKGLGLAEEVKERVGCNFTNVPSSVLEIIIREVLESKKKDFEDSKCNCCCEDEEADAVVALERLLEVLRKKNILLESELDYILQDC